METKTLKLWQKQDQHKGDRLRLFQSIASEFSVSHALYPGSYVDIAPSFIFKNVTYVDTDKRAANFFSDYGGVQKIIKKYQVQGTNQCHFIASDYRSLTLEKQSFDFLISLYAGFISEACVQFLKINGLFLVNPSHGDAALAALDSRLTLVGVIKNVNGKYRIYDQNLGQYMVPKKQQTITKASVIENGRGIAYTKPCFAYLFKKTSE